MMSKKSGNSGDGHEGARVVFEYLKSSQFRVIHADGAIGGITPRGMIHFALYSDRAAIPRKTVNKVNPDGTLGVEIEEEKVVREGVVREMDVDVIMTVDSADGLAQWLKNVVEEHRALQRRVTQKRGK